MDLVEEIYKLVRKLPKEEIYGISDQMRRSAISIPSNIAEGQGRLSDAEFKNFLGIARGSSCELETQILLSVKIGLLSEMEVNNSLLLINEIQKMLYSLIQKLRTKN